MAKGVPILGKDPLGKAKYANVTESGDLRVQLSGASGNIISPATEDKLEQVRQLLAGVATEAKLEQARTLLDAISTKDFATQTTLAAVLTELANVKSELEAIKVNQLTELFGARLSDRPPANSVSVGATFMVVGDTVVYQSNGTDWVVISE